jgi:hypothetical protein
MLELRRPRPIDRHGSPVIRPRLVLVGTQRYHRLNRKRHARPTLAHRLVLPVMWHVRRTMEERIDSVPAVRLDDTEILRLRVFLDDVPELLDRHAGFDVRNGSVEALAGGFDEADVGGVGAGFVADVVGFVEVAVVAFVEEGNVEVEDVAVLEDAGVGDAVADDFVDGGAEGFGKVVVIEGGWVGLEGARSEYVGVEAVSS